MDKNLKIVVNKRTFNLTQSNYKSAGGEGSIYVKDGIGYKIYHEHKKAIHPNKIQELRALSYLKNVLAPLDVVYDYDSGKPVGFTMNFLDNVQFFCKLFTKSFRDRNNISQKMIVEIVKFMQKTLIEIHNHKILVVDYNEMNFLIDNAFKIVYHIDVDSYQTPSYPATALMESIRDRTSKNKFTELTDWFSFGIIAFQLYIGTHPFKGRHPKYSPKEIARLKMMDDDISVFHKDVTLPPNCQDFSAIPKPHLEWFKKVFLNGERCIPPFADQIAAVAIVQKIIFGNEHFLVEKDFEFLADIKDVKFFNGTRYVITEKGIFINKRQVYSFVGSEKAELCNVVGSDPVIAKKAGDKLIFETLEKNELGTLLADGFMELNGFVYSAFNGTLIENSCTKFGSKVVHSTAVVCNIFHSRKMFKGVVIQDILGECWVAIPWKQETCINMRIKEMDKFRIIDAKYENRFCVVIGERHGEYKRFVICFNEQHTEYNIRTEDNADLDDINFTVKENGICIMIIRDEKVEAFFNNSKIKVIENPPFDSSMELYNGEGKVFFANKKILYSVGLK